MRIKNIEQNKFLKILQKRSAVTRFEWAVSKEEGIQKSIYIRYCILSIFL